MLRPDAFLPLKFCSRKGRKQKCKVCTAHASSPGICRMIHMGIQSHQPGRWGLHRTDPSLHLTAALPLRAVSLLHGSRLPHKDIRFWTKQQNQNAPCHYPLSSRAESTHECDVLGVFQHQPRTHRALSNPPLTDGGVVFPLGQLPGLWTYHSPPIR